MYSQYCTICIHTKFPHASSMITMYGYTLYDFMHVKLLINYNAVFGKSSVLSITCRLHSHHTTNLLHRMITMETHGNTTIPLP